MALNLATYLINETAVAARSAQVPAADFTGGVNRGGSSAPGVGINTGNIDPKLSDWTLLDQGPAARSPQRSQHIGGNGLGDGNVNRFDIRVDQDPNFDDTPHFVVADQVAAPGAEYDSVSGAVNRTSVTIQIGDRAWGTVA